MVRRLLAILILISAAGAVAHAGEKCSSSAGECEMQIREMLKGRHYLGILFEETRYGITIREVVEGSPADYSGFLVDDLILAINGRTLGRADAQRFKKVLQDAREKQDGILTVVVSRYGQIRRIRARLGEMPKEQVDKVVARHLSEAHGENANGH